MKELKKIATELGYLKENENDRFKGLDYGIEKTKDYTTSFLDFLKKNIKTVKDDDPKALKRVELRYYQAKFGHNFYELVLLFNNEKFDKTVTSFQNAVVIFKNLGVDTSSEEFIEAVEEHNAEILGMSALLTTTMPNMGKTISSFEEVEMRDFVKIMVGGAPLSQEFADEMGADGFGKDAISCVDLAKQFVENEN